MTIFFIYVSLGGNPHLKEEIMNSIRLVSSQEHNLHLYQAAKKKYDEQYDELEKASSSIVEEIAKKVSEVRRNISKENQIQDACNEVQTQLNLFQIIQNEARDLSSDLRRTLSKIDPASDPLMQKISKNFPEFLEQLDKIHAFVKEHILVFSAVREADNFKGKILEMLENVDNLNEHMQKKQSELNELASQYKEISEKHRGDNDPQTRDKQMSAGEKSPPKVPDPSTYYFPISSQLLGLTFDSPESHSIALKDRSTLIEESDYGFLNPPSSFSFSSSSSSSSFASYSFETSCRDLYIREGSERDEYETSQALERPPVVARIRSRTLPKSRSDSFVSYDFRSAVLQAQESDEGNDSDSYTSDETSKPDIASSVEVNNKPNPVAKIKSKSYECGLGILSSEKHKHITGEYDYEFFGTQGVEDALSIHIGAIHARAEMFSRGAVHRLEYVVFKSQLEYVWAHGEKIVKRIQLEKGLNLTIKINDRITLREELKILIMELRSIDTTARVGLDSLDGRLKWQGHLIDLEQDCDSIVLVAEQMQKIVDQGEAFWVRIHAIRSRAEELSQNSLKDLDLTVFKNLIEESLDDADSILKIFRAEESIYLQDFIVDKVTLKDALKVLVKDLRVLEEKTKIILGLQEKYSIEMQDLANAFQVLINGIEKRLAPWITEIHRGTAENLPADVELVVLGYLGIEQFQED